MRVSELLREAAGPALTPQLKKLVEDAKAKGYEVKPSGSTLHIVKRHRGTGKPLQGIVVYETGAMFDITVDLSVARRIQNYGAARRLLDLD